MTGENKEQGNQQSNSSTAKEFLYLYNLIRFRVRQSFSNEVKPGAEKVELVKGEEPQLPDREDFQLFMRRFFDEELVKNGDWEKTKDKVKVLLIALAPYLYPDLFDAAINKELPETAKDYIQIGGVRGQNCRFFLPTGETSLFLIAGKDKVHREKIKEIYSTENIFSSKKILWLEDMQHSEPPMHGRIIMSQDYVELLSNGKHQSPHFSSSFPAKKISGPDHKNDPETDTVIAGDIFETSENNQELSCKEANLNPWDQLVINEELKEQIAEIRAWLKYNDRLINDFGKHKRFRKGFRALFFGPPGTGKTFTAQLLGRELKKEVYKIDLSMVVSKYIGETEKNLELLFARAEDKNWILFFDEADSLFGKRTNVRDAHDKYANQEVSYLLQRIEDYNGLIILATNMKNNIDDAFIRRFNAILRFSVPNVEERKLIWHKLFPDKKAFANKQGNIVDEEVILQAIKHFELSGGNINNIVHYACLKAYEKRDIDNDHPSCSNELLIIYQEDVEHGIKKEMIKEGKPFLVSNN